MSLSAMERGENYDRGRVSSSADELSKGKTLEKGFKDPEKPWKEISKEGGKGGSSRDQVKRDRLQELDSLRIQLGELAKKLEEKDNELEDILSKRPVNNSSANSDSLIFPIEEIIRVTNNFNSANKIGEGGSGEVFKAKLGHVPVAIKRLNFEQTSSVGRSHPEIGASAKYRHPFLLTLLGHTDLLNERPCLIYPLMPQGSLRSRLDCGEGTAPLNWDIRLKIAWQAATALAYLHRPFPGARTLVHLDVKSDNILLDNSYDCKVSDFGLVRAIGREEVEKTAAAFGTLGYMCPEFVQDGTISEKTDVYAFGVIMFELLTGKKAVYIQNDKTVNLTMLIRDSMPKPSDNFPATLLDPSIQKTWPQDNYNSFAQLGRECLQPTGKERPDMLKVTWKLKTLIDGNYRTCTVCMENPPNARLQCGHASICQPCARYIQQRGSGCPVCRAPIISVEEGIFSRTYVPF